MANVTIGVANPLYIESAATIQTGWMTIQTITWTDDTGGGAGGTIADAQDFTLTDEAGNVICHKQSSANGDGFDCLAFPFGLRVNGLICTVIDGGLGLVYLSSFEG